MSIPRILIVDDDADIREILAFELKLEACEITERDGFLAANRCLENHSFDLIISDMSLGDGNGMELLRRLRTDLRSETPFVLMSGDFRILEANVRAAGAEALIPKPFELPELVPQLFALANRQILRAS